MGALVVAAVVALALRDLPRRWVEGFLADGLHAQVELDRFSIRGPSSFELGGIRILEPALWPEIREIRVQSLEVEAGVRSALAGKYRELVFDGVEVVASPIVGQPSVPVEPAPAVEADTVEVRRARVVLDAGGRELSCDLEAVLGGLGRSVTGRLRARCPHVASAPLLSLLDSRGARAGAAPDPTAPDPTAAIRSVGLELELEQLAAAVLLGRREGGVEARVSAAGGRLSVEGRAAELGPLTGRLFDDPETPRLTAELDPPTLADAFRLEAWLDGASWQWRRAAASVRGLRLAEALGLLPQDDSAWAAEGTADVDLAAAPDTGATATAVVAVRRLTRSGVEQPVRGAALRLEAALRPAGTEPRATLRAAADLPAGADRGLARPLPAGILPLAADLAGAWNETEDRFAASRLTVNTDRFGRLTASGSVGSPLTAPVLLADWAWSGAPLADLRAAAGAAGEDLLRGASLRGAVSGHGGIEGAPASLRASGIMRFEGLDLAAAATAAAAGPRSGEPGTEQPGSEEPRAGASSTEGPSSEEPDAEDLAEATRQWSLRTQPFATAWAWARSEQPIHLAVEEVAATLAMAGYPDLELGIGVLGRLDPAQGAVEIEAARLQTAELGRADISGRLSPAGDTDLRLVWTGADLPAWLARLAPSWQGPWDDLRIRGTAELDLALARSGDGPWQSRGTLALGGAGFEAAGGSRVLDGLRLTADLDATLTPEGSAELRSHIRAGGFQLLWGTLFADYSAIEVGIDVAANGSPGPGGAGWAWDGTARSLLAGDSTLAAGVSLPAAGVPELSLEVEIGALGGFLAEYVRTPFGSAGPLGGLEAGGSLSASLTASLGEASRAVAGRIVATGLAARTDDGGFELAGLDLVLPADLSWRRDDATGGVVVEGPPLPGQLGFAKLTAGGISVPETATTFLVEGDSAALDASLTVPLLGGRVHLDRLTLAELLRPERRLAAALRLEGIRLDEVSRAMDLFPLEGEASGEFPRVRLTADALRVDGGGRVTVFGGEVTLRDISGSQIFSDYPRLVLSADFRDIDAGRLTRKLDFGEVTGIVAGRVEGLELFRGTPVRFRARLASVRRRGQPQTLSLRAVDNIAQLGGGGSLGVLNQGIQRFFDRYRYRELGLAMVLDDDHFLMRGLAHRGGNELFIKGRPPIRLDMVNVKPGRTVSFRTMMERLRNLEVTRRAPGPARP